MSNTSDESETISVEKIRTHYPDISCLISDNSGNANEPSNNVSQVTVTHAKAPTPPTSKVTVIPTIQKKTPLSPGDRKVPPYVNTLPQDPVRVNKSKVVPKAISDKMIVTNEATALPAQPSSNSKVQSGDIKKCLNPQITRANTSQVTPKAKILNVALVSASSSTEENKSNPTTEGSNKNVEKALPSHQNRTPQITTRTSDAFEKNIQSNVLSLSPRPFTINKSPVKITTVKETKPLPESTTNSPTTSKTPPKTPILPTESLCKNNSKSVSVQSADSTSKPVPSRVMPANSTTKSDAVTKNIISKAVTSSDTKTKTPGKIIFAVSSSESVAKSDEKNTIIAKNIIAKTSPSAAKTVSKSPSNVSTTTTPKTESFVIPAVPSHISNNKNLTLTVTQASTVQLSSLSELENNRELREALISGSTASLGENVTISSAGTSVEYIFVHPPNTRLLSDPKIRNVSKETTIETITKQPNNPNSPATKNKNGNANDSVGQSPKQDSSTSSSSADPRNPKVTPILTTTEEIDDIPIENNISVKKIEEPECLTISSDEETEPEQFISSLSDNSDVSVSIMSKEPPIEREEIEPMIADGSSFEREIETQLEVTTGDSFTNLTCRTVRIGSYKVVPHENVTLSKYGLRIVVPAVNNANETVTLKIPIHDIIKVLVHFNRQLPVIFYYVSAPAGARVRKALKMTESSNYYFDPSSEDESHRRITLLPEKFTDANKMNISELYLERDVLDELTLSEANILLVKSAPREIQKVMKQVPPNPVQTIMVFPPPPAKGGISINTEDYSCLAEDVFLNDVIIDFYLKFLYYKRLSEEDRQKTHIFSSFFYKRLTDKATPVPKVLQNSKSAETGVSRAEIRHSRVKNWTKNIDIFSKDYIVIPLNENQHWFLAIICFPGLNGPVRYSDDSPIDSDLTKKSDSKYDNSESEKDSDSQTMTIGSTTITPLSRIDTSYMVSDEDGDSEDRDEADGADEDVHLYTSSEESEDDYSEAEVSETGELKFITKKKVEREPIKQPCILIFDSLAGASRARIIATLRDYLHVEYKTKHNGEERDFTKNVVKGACPRVPQQTNYTDCGLYVLQYVEAFFEDKIIDFHIPIKTLRDWFTAHTVSNKRYEIQQLLLQLMKEQNINVRSLQLPELNLSPHNRYYDSEDLDEYDDSEYYDEGDLEHYRYDQMDEIESHDVRVRENFYKREDDDDDDDDEEHADDDGEYIDEEEIDLDGDRHSKFQMYDSAEESHSEEEISDDDIMYKDLDINIVRNRNNRTVYSVTTKGSADEETIREEEEEVDEEEVEHDLTNDRINCLNKENVTISRMPSNSDKSQSSQSRSSTLEELKNARPWKKLSDVNLETSETGCPAKKFKPN